MPNSISDPSVSLALSCWALCPNQSCLIMPYIFIFSPFTLLRCVLVFFSALFLFSQLHYPQVVVFFLHRKTLPPHKFRCNFDRGQHKLQPGCVWKAHVKCDWSCDYHYQSAGGKMLSGIGGDVWRRCVTFWRAAHCSHRYSAEFQRRCSCLSVSSHLSLLRMKLGPL